MSSSAFTAASTPPLGIASTETQPERGQKMDVSDDPTSFVNVASHEHVGTLDMPHDAPDTTKDGYDTLGLESEHATFTHTEASQQEMEQFLLSAGVEVSAGNHGEHAHAGGNQELELDMEVEVGHDHHGAMMEGILDLASHELHGDDHLPLDLEPHQEPATFDLHQIHQELNDATSLHEHPHDIADASAAQPDVSVLGEEATSHPSLDRALFDSNLAPSPNDRGLPLVSHLQEEPVPTGMQIVNEEVLVNDIGLSPMGESLPSTEAVGMIKQEAELVAEQVGIIDCEKPARAHKIRWGFRFRVSTLMPLLNSPARRLQKCSRHRPVAIRHYPSITLSRNPSQHSTNCSSLNLPLPNRRGRVMIIDPKKPFLIICKLWTSLSEEK